ncbi:MAG: hypothetical protein NZX77_15550, partial [Polyangiaceae bacterium]|nr:hypothetical protein [Polyangiaceae bacterium]
LLLMPVLGEFAIAIHRSRCPHLWGGGTAVAAEDVNTMQRVLQYCPCSSCGSIAVDLAITRGAVQD